MSSSHLSHCPSTPELSAAAPRVVMPPLAVSSMAEQEEGYHGVIGSEMSVATIRATLDEERLQSLLDRIHADLVVNRPAGVADWPEWLRGCLRRAMPPGEARDAVLQLRCRGDVDLAAREHRGLVMRLWRAMQIRGAVDVLNPKTLPRQGMFRQILRSLHCVYESLYAMADATQLAARRTPPCRSIHELPAVWAADGLVPYQKLIMHVLAYLARQGLRRCGTDCYGELMLGRQRTCYWEKRATLLEAVYDAVDKETNFDLWSVLTGSRDCARAIVGYLSCSQDVEFPVLEVNRYLFSFRNGLYDISKNLFVSFDDAGDDAVSARFFDHTFRPEFLEVPVAEIPTPCFDGIFEYQGYDAETLAWATAMCGRLLFPTAEHDNWQVQFYLLGVAGSGKSTLANLVRWLFPPHQVGTLSSNAEPKFALSALYSKLIYVCSEVKSDFKLSQADWQCMVSAEEVQVAIKHAVAVGVRWRVPGLLCGNELPGWLDAMGSVNRRLLVFEFERKVQEGDMHLFSRLKGEVDAFLCKASRGYLELAQRHGGKDIWTPGLLPARLTATHNRIIQEVHPLAAFLNTHKVRLGGDLVTLDEDFQKAYFDYRAEIDVKPVRVQWCDEHFTNAFQDLEIRRSRATHMYKGIVRKGMFLHGIELNQGTAATTALDDMDLAI